MTSHRLSRWIAITVIAASPALAQDAPGPFASFDTASEAVLADPHDLAIGPDGRLYVADKFANRVAVFDPDTLELLETFGEGEVAGAVSRWDDRAPPSGGGSGASARRR